MALPESLPDTETLDDLLSTPPPGVVEAMSRLEGGLVVLGAAGKMGPTLTRMARRASEAAGVHREIVAVSRFSATGSREVFARHGIDTVQCDLLDEAALAALPDAPNVLYMAGMKFGAAQNAALTWAMNAYLPALVARRYPHSRLVAFSTGNVYGYVPATSRGAREDARLHPDGEYAMSCVGRERLFEYFSVRQATPTALLRLNYACEMRYGVLVDIARKVWTEEPVDVTMGCVNVIWQGDANAMALRAFEHTATPPAVLNIAGPEVLRVRELARAFGERMGKTARIIGEEAPSALLNDGRRGYEKLGAPAVPVQHLIDWTADWIMRGGETLDKPTHFEVHDGKF